jgi:hypothetical protein
LVLGDAVEVDLALPALEAGAEGSVAELEGSKCLELGEREVAEMEAERGQCVLRRRLSTCAGGKRERRQLERPSTNRKTPIEPDLGPVRPFLTSGGCVLHAACYI